jgi:hypothetical protein
VRSDRCALFHITPLMASLPSCPHSYESLRTLPKYASETNCTVVSPSKVLPMARWPRGVCEWLSMSSPGNRNLRPKGASRIVRDCGENARDSKAVWEVA